MRVKNHYTAIIVVAKTGPAPSTEHKSARVCAEGYLRAVFPDLSHERFINIWSRPWIEGEALDVEHVRYALLVFLLHPHMNFLDPTFAVDGL